jgi:hypothetical protein
MPKNEEKDLKLSWKCVALNFTFTAYIYHKCDVVIFLKDNSHKDFLSQRILTIPYLLYVSVDDAPKTNKGSPQYEPPSTNE